VVDRIPVGMGSTVHDCLSFLRLEQTTRDEVGSFAWGHETIGHSLGHLFNQKMIFVARALLVDETEGILGGVDQFILHRDDGDVVRGGVVHDVLLIDTQTDLTALPHYAL